MSQTFNERMVLDSMKPKDRVPKNERRGGIYRLIGLVIALIVVLVMVIADMATRSIERRAEIEDLQRQIEQARLTEQQQCWTVGGSGGEPVVRLCATPWKGL